MAFGAFCATAATREAVLGDEGGDPRATEKEAAVVLSAPAGWTMFALFVAATLYRAGVGSMTGSEATPRRDRVVGWGIGFANERVNVWDHRAAPDAAQAVVTAANPPRTLEARCCVESECAQSICRPGSFPLPTVRSTTRNPVRSARGRPPPGPSQKPLDGRNVATLGSSRRGGRWGGCPRFGWQSSDFQGGLTRGSVRARALSWALKRSALLKCARLPRTSAWSLVDFAKHFASTDR